MASFSASYDGPSEPTAATSANWKAAEENAANPDSAVGGEVG